VRDTGPRRHVEKPGAWEHGNSRPPKKSRVTVCQDFEFPVLLVLLYVRVASLFYIERVGPDQF
jgi:hypothetical protein